MSRRVVKVLVDESFTNKIIGVCFVYFELEHSEAIMEAAIDRMDIDHQLHVLIGQRSASRHFVDDTVSVRQVVLNYMSTLPFSAHVAAAVNFCADEKEKYNIAYEQLFVELLKSFVQSMQRRGFTGDFVIFQFEPFDTRSKIQTERFNALIKSALPDDWDYGVQLMKKSDKLNFLPDYVVSLITRLLSERKAEGWVHDFVGLVSGKIGHLLVIDISNGNKSHFSRGMQVNKFLNGGYNEVVPRSID